MSGAILALLQYAFMAWCLVKAQGQLYYYYYYYHHRRRRRRRRRRHAIKMTPRNNIRSKVCKFFRIKIQGLKDAAK
jgi:hypothetical protein